MSEIEVDPQDQERVAVRGELSFASVPALLAQGAVVLAGRGGRVRFDLGGVTRADSAGLALLIEWLRIARRREMAIEFRNMPAQLLTIARVSGLDRILPVAE